MPKECVVHTTKCAEPTTVASARVSRYLSEKLGCPLLDGNSYSQQPDAFDRIFYVNSMGAFADAEFRKWMAAATYFCKQLVYCQQDYTIHPISQTQKIMRQRGWSHDFPFKSGPILWTTVPRFMCKPQDSYVNWNCLTYQPVERIDAIYSGIVYWGSYRQDREESFKRYFGDVPYRVHLLCAPVVFGKFERLGVNGFHSFVKGKPWKHMSELAQYEATLYMEDEKQHGDFHSLANRFYEALSAGLAIFIDHMAVSSFEKAGLAVKPEWVVSCAQDVERLLPHARSVAADQRNTWVRAFRTDLDNQIAEAYRKL